LLHLQLIPEILFQLSESGEQSLDRLFRAAWVEGKKLLNLVAGVERVELRITKTGGVESRVASWVQVAPLKRAAVSGKSYLQILSSNTGTSVRTVLLMLDA
jgi:hypothetical protein